MATVKQLSKLSTEELYKFVEENKANNLNKDVINYIYDTLDNEVINYFWVEQILNNCTYIFRSKFFEDDRCKKIFKSNKQKLLSEFGNSYYKCKVFEKVMQYCYSLTDEQIEKLFTNITPWIRHIFENDSNTSLSEAFTQTFIKQWQMLTNLYSDYRVYCAVEPYQLNDYTITLFDWSQIKGKSRILFDLFIHNYNLLDVEQRQLIISWLNKIVQRKNFTIDKYDYEVKNLPKEAFKELQNELFFKFLT